MSEAQHDSEEIKRIVVKLESLQKRPDYPLSSAESAQLITFIRSAQGEGSPPKTEGVKDAAGFASGLAISSAAAAVGSGLGAVAGAAVGSALLPGIGTLLGAAVGGLIFAATRERKSLKNK